MPYLPALYRNDATCGDFLPRLLSLFESFLSEVEWKIDELPSLFDPAAAPTEFLDWLGGWFGFELDEGWDDARRRRSIAEAFALSARKGTRAGLESSLRLFGGVPAIVEEPLASAAWWVLPARKEACCDECADEREPSAETGENDGSSVLGSSTMLASAQPDGAVAGTTAILGESHLIPAEEFGGPLFTELAHRFNVWIPRGYAARSGVLARVKAVIDRESRRTRTITSASSSRKCGSDSRHGSGWTRWSAGHRRACAWARDPFWARRPRWEAPRLPASGKESPRYHDTRRLRPAGEGGGSTMAHNHGSAGAGDLKSPIRNRYFYGKLLDVHHFKLEQDYFNDKRWLLNRGVAGFGVVCGLGVEWTEDREHVVVHPGVAIDKCGREIIVVRRSEPQSVDLEGTHPRPVSRDECDDDDEWVHVSLCYHECESDPERALGGDCDTEAACAPSSIRERYTIEVLPGRVRAYRPECSIPGVIEDGKIDFRASRAT